MCFCSFCNMGNSYRHGSRETNTSIGIHVQHRETRPIVVLFPHCHVNGWLWVTSTSLRQIRDEQQWCSFSWRHITQRLSSYWCKLHHTVLLNSFQEVLLTCATVFIQPVCFNIWAWSIQRVRWKKKNVFALKAVMGARLTPTMWRRLRKAVSGNQSCYFDGQFQYWFHK